MILLCIYCHSTLDSSICLNKHYFTNFDTFLTNFWKGIYETCMFPLAEMKCCTCYWYDKVIMLGLYSIYIHLMYTNILNWKNVLFMWVEVHEFIRNIIYIYIYGTLKLLLFVYTVFRGQNLCALLIPGLSSSVSFAVLRIRLVPFVFPMVVVPCRDH